MRHTFSANAVPSRAAPEPALALRDRVTPWTTDQAETIREIERLRVLADWYRGWALVSGSERERTSRSGLADDLGAQARGAPLSMCSPRDRQGTVICRVRALA
jgi:hypothetical protein